MLKSLRHQIIFFIGLLVAIIVTQVLLSRASQSALFANQRTVDQAFSFVEKVYQLERDVIDLQRNLLIFKETASESSVQRFDELIGKVTKTVENLNLDVLQSADAELSQDDIGRMLGHLRDYRENFTHVIEGRERRELLRQELGADFDVLQSLTESPRVGLVADEIMLRQVRFDLARARLSIAQYLASPDYDFIEQFDLANEDILENISQKQAVLVVVEPSLKRIRSNFSRLTQTTRGYVFLVNVVMAGSANEFLYLAKNLRAAAIASQQTLSRNAEALAEQARTEADLVSVISLLISIIVAFILTRRVILPITSITEVFQRLAKGESVERVSTDTRDDEIGRLARAAQVFHEKNMQTAALLDEARKMNLYQETLNLQLEEEKHKAEDAARSTSMFLANMSHEIRTPMNGIIGLVNLTLNTELDAQQREYMQKVAYSGKIMLNVINDILDYSKIEAGKLEIERVDFLLDDVIDNVIQVMSSGVEDKQLDIRVIVDPVVPGRLYGDPLRISQVLLNLCSNSIKFTDQGYVFVHFGYEKDEATQKNYLSIKVSDSGIGISEEKQNAIFSSFTQADGSTSRKYGGTGLGLTIVRQLCELMGGDVSVSSQEHVGSRFRVRFAIDPSEMQEDSPCASIPEIDLAGHTLFYLCDSEQAVFTDGFFLGLPNPPAKILFHEFDLSRHDPKSVTLLVDVYFSAGQTDMDAQQRVQLESWSEHGAGIALLCDSATALHLSGSEWPLLSHPISRREVCHFLQTLLSSSPPLVSEAAETEVDIELKGHVLLVEDNNINQLVAGAMLAQVGLTYDVANNGSEAVERVCSGIHYDCVLMDVQMPVMDGYQATRVLRDRGFNDLKICGLSANALEKDFEAARQAGMDDYLTKPIVKQELEAMLKKYIG